MINVIWSLLSFIWKLSDPPRSEWLTTHTDWVGESERASERVSLTDWLTDWLTCFHLRMPHLALQCYKMSEYFSHEQPKYYIKYTYCQFSLCNASIIKVHSTVISYIQRLLLDTIKLLNVNPVLRFHCMPPKIFSFSDRHKRTPWHTYHFLMGCLLCQSFPYL